jgi:hypothetical protein
MGAVCVDMRIMAPFLDRVKDDNGVDQSGDKASSKQHQKQVAKRPSQAQTPEH